MSGSTSKITGYDNEADIEHDEYHSTLEVDDTSGWRLFIVPGILLLLLIGAIAFFIIYSNSDMGPDPRTQARMQAKQKADVEEKARVDARQQAAQAAAWQQTQQAQGAGSQTAPAAAPAAGQ